MEEESTKELPLAWTVMSPEPSAEELGTMLRSTVVGVEETVTLVGFTEQLTPGNEDAQSIVTAPANPPAPET